MSAPHRQTRRFRHVASALAAVLVGVVVTAGATGVLHAGSYRDAAREASYRAEQLAGLGSMVSRFDLSSHVLRDAAGSGDVGRLGVALTDGVDASASTAATWHEVRDDLVVDPDVVARVDAWYGRDGGSVEDLQTGEAGSTAVLEHARTVLLRDIEAVRADLGVLYAHTLAELEGVLAEREAAATRQYAAVATVTGVGLVASLVVGALVVRSERQRLATADRRAAREQLEAQVKRAMAMSDTEASAVAVLVRASRERAGGEVTALLADSSRAHFHRQGGEGATCQVTSPVECPAARQGRTLEFSSSDALDACPHLGSDPPCGAVCVPMAVEGTIFGVLHHATPSQEPSADLRTDLELVAREASQRVGMLRALGVSRAQATTDPLTGLPNRRALEERLRSLRSAQVGYAVAFADLDHFKALNDRHGHEAGDKALLLFARACNDVLRDSDLVARFGGEEFVVVLPGCDEDGAEAILDRLRAELSDACAVAGFPRFTASFGLAVAGPGESIEDVIRRADLAVLEAKREGRDRVVRAPLLNGVAVSPRG